MYRPPKEAIKREIERTQWMLNSLELTGGNYPLMERIKLKKDYNRKLDLLRKFQ
jgi:hypothetical protein